MLTSPYLIMIRSFALICRNNCKVTSDDFQNFDSNILFLDSIKPGTPGSHFGSTRSKVYGNPSDDFKYGRDFSPQFLINF